MPIVRKRRTVRNFRRKKTLGQNFRRKKRPSVPTMKRNVISRRIFTKVTYDSGEIGSVTTTSPAIYQFRANSIFDPDYTGIGHQPRGHDEYASFFRSYRVHGVLVELWANNTTNFTQSIISIYPHKSTSYPVDVTSMLESPDVKFRCFTMEKPLYMKRYINMASLFGKRKLVINSDLDYQAEFNANPVQSGYITILYSNLDGTTSTNHSIRCKLTYFTEMCDPLLLPVS